VVRLPQRPRHESWPPANALKSGLSRLASQGREASHASGAMEPGDRVGHGVWPRSVAMVPGQPSFALAFSGVNKERARAFRAHDD